MCQSSSFNVVIQEEDDGHWSGTELNGTGIAKGLAEGVGMA